MNRRAISRNAGILGSPVFFGTSVLICILIEFLVEAVSYGGILDSDPVVSSNRALRSFKTVMTAHTEEPDATVV